MKLLKNYITESVNHRKFRNISRKEKTGVAFNQPQYKDANYREKITARGSLIVSTAEKKIIGQQIVQI